MIRTDLSVLTDVYDSSLESFKRLSSDLRFQGIRKLVIDLSSVPEKDKLEYMSVLMGVFLSTRFDVRYFGIDKKAVEDGDWGVHREYALLTAQPDLETAVQSFSLTQ